MCRRYEIRLAVFAFAAGLTCASAGLSTSALAVADPDKVIRWYFRTGESGFDPVRISDLNSATVAEAMFERLLTYDYLARPARLAPMAAESLPEIADNGRTYTFRIRKGVYFAPDPAFKGKKRELTAQDFVYSYLRFMDPKNRAPYAFLLAGKLVGLDELADQARKTGRFDYDAPIAGITAVDRYTLRFRLKEIDYNFSYVAAHASFGAVAREIVEAYGDSVDAHPVGTGAYRLHSWVRRSKIVLEANPEYRGFVWDFQPSDEARDATLVATMKGKRMPQVGRVEISIIEEPQSRWLAFRQKELDYVTLPETFAPSALDGDALKPELAREGVTLYRVPDPDVIYTAFNVRDPVIGGFRQGQDRAAPGDGDGL